jgi:hypothetical protein
MAELQGEQQQGRRRQHGAEPLPQQPQVVPDERRGVVVAQVPVGMPEVVDEL